MPAVHLTDDTGMNLVVTPILTLKEAAALVKIDPSTFHTQAKAGNLPRHGFGRIVRYREDQVMLWFENGGMFPGREPAEPPRPKAGTRRRAATGEGIYDPGLKKAYGGTVNSNR